MTPLKLGICLHYHSRTDDAEWIDSGSPIVEDTMEDLTNDGLLVDRYSGLSPESAARPNQRFGPTPKLHAFVAMLEATPLPDQRWVDPRTSETISDR